MPTNARGRKPASSIRMYSRGVAGPKVELITTSGRAGGVVARRLLPAAFLVPLTLGWLRMVAEKRGWISPEFGFVLLSFAVGWLLGGLLRAEPRERFTLAMEFATRNVAIATAVAVTLLGRVEFAVFATTYFMTELPLALVAVALFRRSPARVSSE